MEINEKEIGYRDREKETNKEKTRKGFQLVGNQIESVKFAC